MDHLGVLAAFVGLLAFDLAAWRWGVNSVDGPDSLEWERRRDWLTRLTGR